MPYQIASFSRNLPNEKIIHHEKADSQEDAIVLLNKFRYEEIQLNNEVSEIENNLFCSIDSVTEQEKIFEISEV